MDKTEAREFYLEAYRGTQRVEKSRMVFLTKLLVEDELEDFAKKMEKKFQAMSRLCSTSLEALLCILQEETRFIPSPQDLKDDPELEAVLTLDQRKGHLPTTDWMQKLVRSLEEIDSLAPTEIGEARAFNSFLKMGETELFHKMGERIKEGVKKYYASLREENL